MFIVVGHDDVDVEGQCWGGVLLSSLFSGREGGQQESLSCSSEAGV